MLSLTAPQMAQVSRLWDEALALKTAARRDWLDHLRHPDPLVRQSLDRLCGSNASTLADDGFMQQVPILDLLPPTPAPSLHRPGDVVGPYRLDIELGRGGMGVVWAASRADGLVEHTVALKLPHPWLAGPSFLRRFARECDILASLDHPNIAGLHDAGVSTQGQPYFALERIEGVPITTYCAIRGPDLPQRIALFLQVLDAVQYAHGRGVVHRDLKPANILVSGNGQVHLLDFGIATLLDDPDAPALSQRGAQWGWTPAYASPEQIAGKQVGAQSDVFSLGVMFHELICGRRPCTSDGPARPRSDQVDVSDLDALQPDGPGQAAQGSPESPATSPSPRRPRLDGLDVIALTALRHPLDQRYASALAFAHDLRRHQAGLPPLSRAHAASSSVPLRPRRLPHENRCRPERPCANCKASAHAARQQSRTS